MSPHRISVATLNTPMASANRVQHLRIYVTIARLPMSPSVHIYNECWISIVPTIFVCWNRLDFHDARKPDLCESTQP